ncbi:hypothetical protein PYCC9005_001590 [Savitreella phatthalungensis]
MADETVSTDYKWAKDSYMSLNHPTAGTHAAADITSQTRLELHKAMLQDNTDTQGDNGNTNHNHMDNMRRLARMLDQYRTPSHQQSDPAIMRDVSAPNVAAGPGVNGDASARMGSPQAASSPRTEFGQIERSISAPLPHTHMTPGVSIRSASPEQRSRSPAWHRHPPGTAGHLSLRDLSDIDETPLKARISATEPLPEDTTIMRRVRMVQEHQDDEVSYGTNTPMDETPSIRRTDTARRTQQPYWTAKEDLSMRPAERAINDTAGSLHVASPSMYRAGPRDHSLGSLPTESPAKEMRPSSDIGVRPASDVSRADSQATSLQQAISNALATASESGRGARPTTGANSLPSQTPIEDAIVTRYRQSLGRNPLLRTPLGKAQRIASGSHVASASSRLNIVPPVTAVGDPVKPGSPLISQHAELYNDSTHTTRRDQPSKTKDEETLLTALQAVQDECSRRGDVIDGLERAAEAETSRASLRQGQLKAELAAAQATAVELEARLRGHEAEMAALRDRFEAVLRDREEEDSHRRQMIDAFEALKLNHARAMATPDATPPVPVYHDIDDTRAAQPSVHEMTAGIDSHAEESLQDKMTRWQDGAASGPPEDTLAPQDSASAAPSVVLEEKVAIDHTEEVRQLRDQVARLTAENATLRTHAIHEEPGVREIAATSMPDYDCARGVSRTFETLHLSRIDALGHKARGNLCKNLLIQLALPYDADLATAVPNLVRRLHTAERDLAHTLAHDAHRVADDAAVLVHESLKLREFAETVHATLYAETDTGIDGVIIDERCLRSMASRVHKLNTLYLASKRTPLGPASGNPNRITDRPTSRRSDTGVKSRPTAA